jgi:hypothetical protein
MGLTELVRLLVPAGAYENPVGAIELPQPADQELSAETWGNEGTPTASDDDEVQQQPQEQPPPPRLPEEQQPSQSQQQQQQQQQSQLCTGHLLALLHFYKG